MIDSQSVLCIIPARGGSERVPGKNIMPLCGRPMLAYTIVHALAAECADEVVVSTEDAAIARVARDYGAVVVDRPPALASNEMATEPVLVDVLEQRAAAGQAAPDIVVLLQATSPARKRDEVDRAVRTLLDEGADSLFSAASTKYHSWNLEDGVLRAVSYNVDKRLREQDMAPQFTENGSIFVFRTDVLDRHGNRLGGKIAVHEMDMWSSFQVDTPEDVELIQWVLGHHEYQPDWPSEDD